MNQNSLITDHQLMTFMLKMSSDQRDKNALLLTEWESNFVASFARSANPSNWFTQGRRASTEKLWMRYGGELKHPHPLDAVAERPTVADADPDGCEYLVRDAGRQARCNQPAVLMEPRHLRYCQIHADQVRRACKNIVLVPFKTP